MLRSLLFLPGNNPNMLINAAYLGADAVIFDLEDAVAPDQKDAARILVRNTLQSMEFPCVRVVRINAIDTAFWRDDVEAILPHKPDYLLLPKTSTAQDILLLDECLAGAERANGLTEGTVGIFALIETALGVEQAYAIATASPRVKALFLGAEDLTADLQCKRTREGREIAYSRSRLVVAARAAGIEVYDTPFTDVNDDEGVRLDAELAKSLGFTGKASISPRHVDLINRIFSPSADEIAYAHEVLAAIAQGKREGKGAVSLRGKMIDAPIVKRAERTLSMAKALGLKGGDRD